MNNFGKLNAAIYRNMQSILHFKLRHLGLGFGQYAFFFLIGRNPGITQKELTEHMHVEKSTTAKAIKILEDNGFIYRDKDENDRRMERLSLTPEGNRAVRQVNKAFSDNLTLAAMTLDQAEQETLLAMLEKVLNSLAAEKNRLYSEAGQATCRTKAP